MAKAAEIILRTLDKYVSGPVHLRLIGGAAMILAYGLERATEDADLLIDDQEAQFLAEHRNLGPALEQTNAELEPLGLYISNLWGPEQQILTPAWREQCRPITNPPKLDRISLETLGPLDIIVSKMARADDGDLADIVHLITHERLTPAAIRAAIASARVPEVLRDAFADSEPRVLALLA